MDLHGDSTRRTFRQSISLPFSAPLKIERARNQGREKFYGIYRTSPSFSLPLFLSFFICSFVVLLLALRFQFHTARSGVPRADDSSELESEGDASGEQAMPHSIEHDIASDSRNRQRF